MLPIIQKRVYGFIFSGLVFALAVGSWLTWGLNLGIDFTGGSLLEIDFEGGRPAVEEVSSVASASIGSDDLFVQPLGETGMVLRMPTLDETAHQKLINDLRGTFQTAEAPAVEAESGIEVEAVEGSASDIEVSVVADGASENAALEGVTLEELRFESVGPVIGEELRRKTVYAVIGAILAVVLYITYVFRKVSRPISAWKYGATTIAALTHDVMVPIGAYAALGHFYNVEVGAWVVTALLTVLGFSVHDTIVVFDRIRENLGKHRRESFEETVNRSVNESLARSINTSVTLLFVLVAAYFLGGESLKHFLMVLIIGVSAGTYSSIFVASPLLVSWELWDRKRR